MAQIRHDSRTGEHFVYDPASDQWQPISRDEAIEIQKAGERGPIENSLRAGWDSAVDTASMVEMINPLSQAANLTGAIARGEDPMAALTRPLDRMRANDAAQSARGRVAPGTELAGMVLDPTNLLPGGFAAKEGGRVAVPVLSRGAQRGIDLAEGVIKSNALRSVKSTGLKAAESIPGIGPIVKDVADGISTRYARSTLDRKAAQSLSAAVSDPQRFRPGLMTADEIANFVGGGYNPERLHAAQIAKLEATDAAQHQSARNVLQETEAFEAGTGGGSLTDSVEELQMLKNRTYMREIGADENVLPEVDTLGDNLTRISNELNQIRGTAPVDVDGLADDITKELKEERALSAEAERAVDKALGWIADMSDGGLMDPQNASVIENRLSREIRSKASSQSDTEVVEAMSDVLDKVRDRIRETLTPDQIEQDKVLRRQWGLTMSALNRGGALGSDGINIKSFLSSVGSKNRAVKTGRSSDPLIKFLRTVQELTGDRLPKSGTAERLSIIGSGR